MFGYESNTSVLMSKDRTARAVFTPAEVYLDMAVSGGVAGSCVSPQAGRHGYRRGANVRVFTSAPTGWYFDQWQGAVDADDSYLSDFVLSMSDDRSVTAAFEPIGNSEVVFSKARQHFHKTVLLPSSRPDHFSPLPHFNRRECKEVVSDSTRS